MSQPKKLEFAERLREFRGRAKLSQVELAERLGIGGNYLSMIELGKRVPGPTVIKLFESLEHSAADTPSASNLELRDSPRHAGRIVSLLSTETLIQNFVEVAEKLPLGGVPEKKQVVGSLREYLDAIEQRLLASSGGLSEAQRIAMQAAKRGGPPGTK